MDRGKGIKDKIRKLLALSESPNENEARAALLKARQLMAEHKLTERELRDAARQAVKTVSTGITCSKRRNPWIVNLSATIGENYCCMGIRTHSKGKQTQSIGFLGFEDDAELCKEIFEYAVDCVLAEIKGIREECDWHGLSPEYARRRCDSFGYGFVTGVDMAFDRQQEEHKEEWGLVLVIPKEVEEAAEHLGHADFSARAEENILGSAFFLGQECGKSFRPGRRLSEGATG